MSFGQTKRSSSRFALPNFGVELAYSFSTPAGASLVCLTVLCDCNAPSMSRHANEAPMPVSVWRIHRQTVYAPSPQLPPMLGRTAPVADGQARSSPIPKRQCGNTSETANEGCEKGGSSPNLHVKPLCSVLAFLVEQTECCLRTGNVVPGFSTRQLVQILRTDLMVPVASGINKPCRKWTMNSSRGMSDPATKSNTMTSTIPLSKGES